MTLGDRTKVVNFYPTVYSTEYDRSFNHKANTHSRIENVETPQGILKVNKKKTTKVPLKVDTPKHCVDLNTSKKHHKHHLHNHYKAKSSLTKTQDLSSGKSSLHKKSHEQKDYRFKNQNLVLTAGIPSTQFTYSPYIQKKRIVAHQGDCTVLGDNMAFNGYLKQDHNLHRYTHTDLKNSAAYQPEPCLQRKRITLYKNNHNILCTYTTKELSGPVVLPTYSNEVSAEPFFQKSLKSFPSNYQTENDKKNISDNCLNLYLEGIEDLSQSRTKEIMSQYHAHKIKSFPGQYQTTYNHDYSPKLKKLSPVIAADLMLREKKISSDKDIKLSSMKSTTKRSENLNSAQSKYNKSQETAQPYMAENYDDDFIEYYRRILEDRYYNYHPMMVHKINQERENLSINISERSKDQNENPDNKFNLTTENQELINQTKKSVSSGSDSSSFKQSLFKKKTKDSVCSCSSYDSRYSLSYDPSLYSDSAERNV